MAFSSPITNTTKSNKKSANLSNVVNNLKAQKKQLDVDLKKIKTEISEKEKFNKELIYKKEEMYEIKAFLKNSETEFEKFEKEATPKLKKICDEIDQKNSEKEALNKKYDKIKKDFVRDSYSHKELKSEIQEFNKEKKTLQKETYNLKNKNDLDRVKNKNLLKEIEVNQKKTANTINEIQEIQSKLDNAQEKSTIALSKLETEQDDQSRQHGAFIDRLKKDKAELEKAIEGRNAKIDKREKKLETRIIDFDIRDASQKEAKKKLSRAKSDLEKIHGKAFNIIIN